MASAGKHSFAGAVRGSLALVTLLFAVFCVQALFRLPLHRFGIVPRTLSGLPGILFSPLLHADLQHLLANSLPLFVLLILVLSNREYHPLRTLLAHLDSQWLGNMAHWTRPFGAYRRQRHHLRPGRLSHCGGVANSKLEVCLDRDRRRAVVRRDLLRRAAPGWRGLLGRPPVRRIGRSLAGSASPSQGINPVALNHVRRPALLGLNCMSTCTSPN